MNIVIMHYHLNRGGVTRVIANQLLALDHALHGGEPCRVALLFGGRDEGWDERLVERLTTLKVTRHALPTLDYDPRPVAEPEKLAAEIRKTLAAIDLKPSETILHIHNHNLGKNASLPGALRSLSGDGFALLLQVHDFAEDFRPDNYRLLAESLGEENLRANLYPLAPQIHYAALSRRDVNVLTSVGIMPERLHWLPNPVPVHENMADRQATRAKLQKIFGISSQHRYALYPVRGIRRKNLGEMLLWSALAGEQTQFGLTLAPINPAERSYYESWKALATELSLPCHFETGGLVGLDFVENLAAADLILTTSVAEGFGMVFLESWLANRPLAGRDLPEITVDFVEAGLKLDGLYHRLNVPVTWVGRDEFHRILKSSYNRVLAGYSRPAIDEDILARSVAEKIQHDCVDFADLDEKLQECVIRRVHADHASREQLLALNPKINKVLQEETEGELATIDHNRNLIENQYSLASSGRRLLEIYRGLLTSPHGPITEEKLGPPATNRFLDFNRFRPIRG